MRLGVAVVASAALCAALLAAVATVRSVPPPSSPFEVAVEEAQGGALGEEGATPRRQQEAAPPPQPPRAQREAVGRALLQQQPQQQQHALRGEAASSQPQDEARDADAPQAAPAQLAQRAQLAQGEQGQAAAFWQRPCRVRKSAPLEREEGGAWLNAKACDATARGAQRNDSWLLQKTMMQSRRNHDSYLREDTLVHVLGRWAESVEVLDLRTGEASLHKVSGQRDPDGKALGDFNHVYIARVESLERGGSEEIWLACGFHGHEVGKEVAGKYVRILDPDTLKVRLGPRLPSAGGACSALPLPIEGAGRPKHVCTFGGTMGSHDYGPFLDQVACYDRLKGVWNHPMGRLPFGLDHSNAIHVLEGACSSEDPPRVLVMNFRIVPWGEQRPEIFAFDLPRGASGFDSLNRSDSDGWYLFYNNSGETRVGDTAFPRDASGVFTASGGRFIFNAGGAHYHWKKRQRPTSQIRPDSSSVFSQIRVFDVCERRWKEAGELQFPVFAMQSASSARLNVAVTCGGDSLGYRRQDHSKLRKNAPWCQVSAMGEYSLDDRPAL